MSQHGSWREDLCWAHLLRTKPQQDAVEEGRLRQRVATWRTGRNIRAGFDSGPFAPLFENKTLSTKPKVHDVLHCRQRRTEPRPQ